MKPGPVLPSRIRSLPPGVSGGWCRRGEAWDLGGGAGWCLRSLPPGAADGAACMLGRPRRLITFAPACDPLNKFMSMSVDPHFTSWFLHVFPWMYHDYD
jgi:hypothetical protein